jgi:hypothetical protein
MSSNLRLCELSSDERELIDQQMLDEARSKMIVARAFADGLAMLFCPTISLTLKVAARRSESIFRVRACFKRYRPTTWFDDKDYLGADYLHIDKKGSSRLRQELDTIITSMMHKPLTPKMVCEALEITSSERMRQTREGKLIREGQGSFNSDVHKGYYQLYSANCIRRLLLSEANR